MTATIPADRVFGDVKELPVEAWNDVTDAVRGLDDHAEIRLLVAPSGTIGGTVVSKVFEHLSPSESEELLRARVPERSRQKIGYMILRPWGGGLL